MAAISVTMFIIAKYGGAAILAKSAAGGTAATAATIGGGTLLKTGMIYAGAALATVTGIVIIKNIADENIAEENKEE